MHPHLRRWGLSALLIALLATATPALVRAQGTGDVGADHAHAVQPRPFPSSPHMTITAHPPEITPGHVLPGQDDVPPEERLRTPDRIIFSATAAGTGGGPMQDGGQCAPTEVPLRIELQLPGVAPHMNPPAPSIGGLGGVVTVPTWFWFNYTSDPEPTSTSSGDYITCLPHPDPLLDQTWWSPDQQTATIRLTSAPTGYFWDFGDREVSASCRDSASGVAGGLAGAGLPSQQQHAYCFSSIRGQHPDGYPVFIKVQFLAHAFVNDQELVQMDVASTSISRYPVREVQAVLDE
jgi:hypothetical protein